MELSSTVTRAGAELPPAGRWTPQDYGRLFGNLPAWQAPSRSDAVEYLWDLSEGLYTSQARDNPSIPAGYTYLAQLVNHDLSFDASASLDEKNVPPQRRNLRTPRFDLDCLYGRGPADQPYLYAPHGDGQLLLERTQADEYDLLRSPLSSDRRSRASQDPSNLPRAALIGDARNDENLIIAQLHLAFIRFHNRQVDALGAFEAARRATRWHYQWVAIHDLLKRLCGATLVDAVLGAHGRPALRIFDPCRHGCVPIEFSLAAYRFGHAMVRDTYALSDALEARLGGPLAIFDPIAEDGLGGGRVLPPGWSIQWDRFVDGVPNGGPAQFSQRLGPAISRALRMLPVPAHVPPRHRSLAFRTLLRGWQMGLPSGQDVARRMVVSVLDPDASDPLWLYVLKEAAVAGGGQLGPVGGRIVAEVFVGLLAADPSSFLSISPAWTPSSGPEYRLADFLADAGAPRTATEWQARGA